MNSNKIDKKITNEKGSSNFNKALLDAQFDYIKSLGNIVDIKPSGDEDLIISTTNENN